MSQTIGRKDGTTSAHGTAGHDVVDPAGSKHGITGKGLKGGQLGLLAVVVLGISSVAPAYSLTSSLGPAVGAVGVQLPAIFIVAFIPMILVAFAYRELNADPRTAAPRSPGPRKRSARSSAGWAAGVCSPPHHRAVQPGRRRGGLLLPLPGPGVQQPRTRGPDFQHRA